MVDVKVWAPKSQRDAIPSHTLISVLRPAVSEALDCVNDDGENYKPAPEDCEVQVFYIDDEDRATGQTLIIEIAAYDFKDRMNRIEKSMQDVADAVVPLVPEVPGRKKVSVNFIPSGVACWVISSD